MLVKSSLVNGDAILNTYTPSWLTPIFHVIIDDYTQCG
jgi:hypothetical protein